MSLLSRFVNAFRSERVNRELDEEMQSHLEEAEAAGRAPEEARRALGPALRHREESRDFKVAAWLDSLRADTVFGWRQLRKHRTASAAAILSLALAIGACTTAFRLVDALLLRPMPIAHPERLSVLSYELRRQGGFGYFFEYPAFRALRQAVREDAELLAISFNSRVELTYGGERDVEKAYRQHVSGWTFDAFGLRPAAGRLLTANDDVKPDAHPVAVISDGYWMRRFGRDSKAVGRKFRLGMALYEIVGVTPPGFTGTETGSLTDIFIPTMMNGELIENANWTWLRILVQRKPGADETRLREKLHAALASWRRSKVDAGASASKDNVEEYVSAPVFLEPAAAGVSNVQRRYRSSLIALAGLAGLVLLIACANVANLLAAQGAARAREMALRVSIGAGRWRLVQLVLAESALIALAATALGGLFAWQAAPFVTGMIGTAGAPVQLILPADWRLLAFSAALAFSVTLLFGVAPALRASAVKPVAALKGGDDPHARRRLMNSLVAAQVAFCILVNLVAGLFVSSFDRLANQPTGFVAEQAIILETSTSPQEAPVEHWLQLAAQLRTLHGVESAAVSGWPLMGWSAWKTRVWAGGKSPEGGDDPYLLPVSPGWLDVMKIPMLDGRDLRANEVYPDVAIVNEEFAQRYFDGRSPVGRSFEVERDKGRVRVLIAGYVRNARYRDMHEPMRPTLYVPMRSRKADGGERLMDGAAFLVRAARGVDLAALAPRLREAVSAARAEFRVTDMDTQLELVRSHTMRERLLATLSVFFAAVALALAAVGLYGVLDYAVLQRRREIGIRLALGARPDHIVHRVTAEIFAMIALGSIAGLAAGAASERYLASLLFQVRATEPAMLALPVATIFAASLLAALPPVLRAVSISPASMLRSD